MGIETVKPTLEEEIALLEKKLQTLRGPEETAGERLLRELREEIEFEEMKRKHPKDSIGRFKAESGQLLFRQLYANELKRREDVQRREELGELPRGSVETQDELNNRSCLLSPPWETYQEWLHRKPFLRGEFAMALLDHLKDYRRERAGK